jgi:hypothetical protein
MSRGPGRIERAIRALLDAHPDEAFTTDDLAAHCYPDADVIEHKHRVAVVRAANKVIAGDPDWRRSQSSTQGAMLVFHNAASVPSLALACILDSVRNGRPHDWIAERAQTILDGSSRYLRDRASIEREVRQHIAIRDARDPAEAARLRAEYEAAKAAECAAFLAAHGVAWP